MKGIGDAHSEKEVTQGTSTNVFQKLEDDTRMRNYNTIKRLTYDQVLCPCFRELDSAWKGKNQLIVISVQ
jgi:hypothetical protein